MFTCAICGGTGSAESMGPNLMGNETNQFPPSGEGAKWYHITCWVLSPGTGQDEHGLSSYRGHKPPTVTGQTMSKLYGARGRILHVAGGHVSLLRNLPRGASQSRGLRSSVRRNIL